MTSSLLALVLLQEPTTPNAALVVKALRSRHPDLAAEVVDEVDSSGSMDLRQPAANALLIRCGGEMVAVMSMPAPIRPDPGLWSRAATAWPDCKTVAASHRGHLVVSVVGKTLQPLPAARLTTAVIGALIATMPASCAVVWDTKVARPAKLWMEMSRQSFAQFPDYPFTLWIDIMPFRSEAGIGAVTMGLSAFAGREIEFETDKLPLRTMIDRVSGLAVYLIEHGAVVKDGDTFGGDERERITARLRVSERFADLPVVFCTA